MYGGTVTALRRELGPWGVVAWAASLAFAGGIACARIYSATEPQRPPPITADWQCGLAPSDYAEGECGNPEAITFCVGRCP